MIIDAIVRNVRYFLGDAVDVMLAKLPPLPALRDGLIYAVKQTMDSFLIVIQNLHFPSYYLLFQVFKGHLDFDCVSIQHIIEYGLAVNQPLSLKLALGDYLF